MTQTADYDDLDRLKTLSYTKGAATLANFGYQYNERNLITQMTDGAGTHTFGYDELQRLTSAAHPAGQTAESYQYDEVGNRTSSHITTSYNTQPFNRVVQIGSTTFAYDDNGNLETKTDGTGTTLYVYDYENRLVSVHLPNAKTIHYKYDALGRRIERHDAQTNAWQRYTYDGWEVAREIHHDGNWTNYVNGDELDDHLWQWQGDGIVASSTELVPRYYLTDHQGSLRGLADANGNVIGNNQYDSFGTRTGSTATRFGYTGREHDPDTGLMYYRARWYDPASGRFISEDPIGLAGGINLYAYVENDPVNDIDPTGLRGRKRRKKSPASTPATSPQPACATTAVTVNIWYMAPGSMGHGSLTLSSGENLGWWPTRNPGWKGLEAFWGIEGVNKSYVAEIRDEKRTPEHVERLYGLDQTKMQNFYDEYTRTHPYWKLRGSSCTTVAAQTIIAGMPENMQEDARKKAHATSPSGIMYPKEFHRFAQWVKGFLQNGGR